MPSALPKATETEKAKVPRQHRRCSGVRVKHLGRQVFREREGGVGEEGK